MAASQNTRTPRYRLSTGYILVFDTETTIDTTQRLLFGTFRYCYADGDNLFTLAEGIIYADELPETDPDGYAALYHYAHTHAPDIDRMFHDREPNPYFEFLSRDAFVRRWLWLVGYKHAETVVGFNLPFDLTRLAVEVGDARKDFEGGFSLALWKTRDGRLDTYKPRLKIKMLDSKKAFIRYAATNTERYRPGRFVDLRTLTFALTNRSHSLASACEVFEVEHGKITASEHGIITPDYIDYARRDVHATAELYSATTRELARHGLDTPPEHIYSPASLAKAYFRKMRIPPPVQRNEVDPAILTDAMASFYGARAECRIRRQPMPVAQLDFTSMYPTVNTLMGIWGLLTAEHIAVTHQREHVQTLLNTITLDQCFTPDTWRDFVGIAKIIPDQDILPVRGQYSGQAWTIGINYLTADDEYWYAIPDLIASTLLTGKAPRVVEAIQFRSEGTTEGLRPVALRGTVPILPDSDDFFPRIVEERQKWKNTATGDFLKVLANSGCYGIFAEINKREPRTPQESTTETPGPYTFPPIATCITAAARLMLAMLERCVTDAGGSWVFTDTDSMAIVSGDTSGETDGIPRLDYATVDTIRERFNRLNPYRSIPDLLKLEYHGWCYAISAKRYALYHTDAAGQVSIDKNSEHGLGHLLNPSDPNSGKTHWIQQLWQYLITRDQQPEYASEPPWLDRPAISRYSVSQTALLRSFDQLNDGKPYPERIKPANFILVAHAHKIQPSYRQRVTPIAPYEPDASHWLQLTWRNKHAPAHTFTVDTFTHPENIRMNVVYVQSYRDITNQYLIHPETKFNQTDGHSCTPGYRGLLIRKHVRAVGTTYLGKESNQVEQVQRGLLAPSEVTRQYGLAEWERIYQLIKPIIAAYSVRELARTTGIPRTTAGYILAGRPPSSEHASRITHFAATVAADDIGERFHDDENPITLLMKWRDTILLRSQQNDPKYDYDAEQ